MNYFVDFIAYIDELKRPENFPHELHMQDTYTNIEGLEQLQHEVNKRFLTLIMGAGVVVFKEQDKIQDSNLTFDQRRFVPWHMITHMELAVKLIPEQTVKQDLLAEGEPPSEVKPKKQLVN